MEAFHDSGTVVVVVVPAVRPVGTEGAVVSVGPVDVVAETEEEAAETLPAASLARTVNEYVVAAVRPVTV